MWRCVGKEKWQAGQRSCRGPIINKYYISRVETVTVQAQSLPDASLVETVDRPVGRPGETVIFTIQARNTGNVPLLNARLTAPLLRTQVRIAEFDVGASETLRIPFVLPDVEEDTVIVSPVTLVSDNGPTREASASVRVIAEEEE